MGRLPMPLTTESEYADDTEVSARKRGEEGLPHASARVGDQSGYDVVNSAASPHEFARPKRWDLFLLYNVAIPILLVLAGVLIFRTLGVAEAKPVPPPDTSPTAVLQSLPATRVERVRSLAETGQQLELVIDGTVVPFREARVASEVAGTVIEKSANCEAGSIVTQGEVLMRIDPQDYELEVERLKNQRDREYRAISENDQEIANTQRSIEIAREDVKLQQKEVDRQAALKTFASQAEVDKARSALLQANQQLVTWENQLDLLRSRRLRLEAAEQLAATQLRAAEVNLKRCTIVAPISGVIVSEQADVNSFVNRGATLVTIEDTEKVEVAASMRMDQLHWVLDQKRRSDQEPTGQSAGYDLPATEAIIEYEVAGREGTVHRWNGTLVSYDGIGIDPNTRTVPVRLLVDDPTHYIDEKGREKIADRTNALLRGMFVRVRLQLRPQSELVVIPAKALRPGNRVWKFHEDEAVLTEQVAAAKKAAQAAPSTVVATPATDANAPQPGDESEAPQDQPFDPAAWNAGLVRYSQTVFPIDSLRLRDARVLDPNLAPSLQSPDRVWVCEADTSDLAAGDYVVVSPLDSIPPEGLPARAEIQE
ncbi:Toluene efflux pump periplasmic linker protein TtgA precursor [Stieleria neptunia]|uniref:Toluene efflux pump periplasmic linker protein TtgA n=2 Tax=Stieleria neptunia TaxID=2527979 RepID=A0A518HTV9_9BACT|nr:Toluene efflux pump periplasmic linker protein TtgA precursor [Stieleria neptunia]